MEIWRVYWHEEYAEEQQSNDTASGGPRTCVSKYRENKPYIGLRTKGDEEEGENRCVARVIEKGVIMRAKEERRGRELDEPGLPLSRAPSLRRNGARWNQRFGAQLPSKTKAGCGDVKISSLFL